MPPTIGTPSATLRRPEIFISACSADLRTVREEVKRAVDAIGCHGVYQESFAPDYGTVAEMLRRHIAACDAVIHIAGKCYGAEPRDLPPNQPRVSYTQLEYYLARELGKKLYVFVATDQFPFDPCGDESEEKQRLQQKHCQMLLGDVHLREKVDSRERLAIRVRELRETLEALRKETVQVHRRLGFLAAMLVVVVGVAGYFGRDLYRRDKVRGQETADAHQGVEQAKKQSGVAQETSQEAKQASQEAKETSAAAKKQSDELRVEVNQLGQAVTLLEFLVGEVHYGGTSLWIADEEHDASEAEANRRTEAALNRLTRKKGITREQLDQQIREAVDRILQSSESSPYAKSLAAYSTRRYADAVQWAEQAVADVEKEVAAMVADPSLATEVKVRATSLAKYRALLLSGDGHFAQKIYSEAEAKYRLALELVPREEYGSEWDVAIEKLASVVWRLEKHREAEALFRAMYEYRRQAYGETDPRTGGCLNAIGTALINSGQTQEASRYLREAIAFSEAAFGREAWQVAIARTNLGHALMAMNRYDEAREEFVEAMRIKGVVYGESHVEMAYAINNLAGLDVQTGRRIEAIAEFRQTLALFEKNLGTESPELVMVLNNLAENLSNQSEYREAEQHARRALAIAQSKTGTDSPPTARALGNVARAIRHSDPAAAEGYLKEALRIDELRFGADSDAVGVDCDDLGNLLSDQGRWSEAEAYYERAEKVARRAGPINGRLAVALNNRALMWMQQGQWARAQPLLVQAIDIEEALHGPEFSGLITPLANLASVEEELEHVELSLSLLRRALAIARKSYGEDAADVGDMWHKLGWTLYRHNQTAMAEQPIRRALKIHEAKLGTISKEAGHCLYALVQILNETQRWPASVAIANEALAVAGALQQQTGKAVYYDEDLREAASLAFSSQGWNAAQVGQAIEQRRGQAPSQQPISPTVDRWLGPLPTAP